MSDRRPILCLWGFMGTGKSTVGALVAKDHGATFVDLDAEIEAHAGKTISDIFAEDGEAAFRALEREHLIAALDSKSGKRVIALGGGALVDAELRARARSRAFVVTLTASVEEILERTQVDHGRPLLETDRKASIEQLLQERSEAYVAVHLTLATHGLSARQVASRLSKSWKPETE